MPSALSTTAFSHWTTSGWNGSVWDMRQLAKDFVLTSIIGEYVIVRRGSDGVVGRLTYQNSPRYFYWFVPAVEVA